MPDGYRHYRAIYKQRKLKPHTSIIIEGPNVLDASGPNLPKIPPKPEGPSLPIDDEFKDYRDIGSSKA